MTGWGTSRAEADPLGKPSEAAGGAKVDAAAAAVLAAAGPGVVVVQDMEVAFTGVLLDSSGLIVTSDAVVSLNFDLKVRALVGQQGNYQEKLFEKVVLIGVDKEKGLALIRVNPEGARLTPCRRAVGTPKPGETTYAVGIPNSRIPPAKHTLEAMRGVSSGVRQDAKAGAVIQSDSAIKISSWGGGLVDSSGALLGVLVVEAAGKHGLGFSIPIQDIDPKRFKPVRWVKPTQQQTQRMKDIGEAARLTAIAVDDDYDVSAYYFQIFLICNRALLKFNPEEANPYLVMEEYYNSHKRQDVAKAYLELGIKNAPMDRSIRLRQAEIANQAGDLKAVEKLILDLYIEGKMTPYEEARAFLTIQYKQADPLKMLYVLKTCSHDRHNVESAMRSMGESVNAQQRRMLGEATSYSQQGLEDFLRAATKINMVESSQFDFAQSPARDVQADVKTMLSAGRMIPKGGITIRMPQTYEASGPATTDGLYMSFHSDKGLVFFSPLENRITAAWTRDLKDLDWSNRVLVAPDYSRKVLEVRSIATGERLRTIDLPAVERVRVVMHPDNDRLALVIARKGAHPAYIVNLEKGAFLPLVGDGAEALRDALEKGNIQINGPKFDRFTINGKTVLERDGAIIKRMSDAPWDDIYLRLTPDFFIKQGANSSSPVINGPGGTTLKLPITIGGENHAGLKAVSAILGSRSQMLVKAGRTFQVLGLPGFEVQNRFVDAREAGVLADKATVVPGMFVNPQVWASASVNRVVVHEPTKSRVLRVMPFDQTGVGVMGDGKDRAAQVKSRFMSTTGEMDLGPLDISSLVEGVGARGWTVVTSKAHDLIYVIDPGQGKVVFKVPLLSPKAVFAAGGNRLVILIDDPGVVETWDLATGKQLDVSPIDWREGKPSGIWMGAGNDELAVVQVTEGVEKTGATPFRLKWMVMEVASRKFGEKKRTLVQAMERLPRAVMSAEGDIFQPDTQAVEANKVSSRGFGASTVTPLSSKQGYWIPGALPRHVAGANLFVASNNVTQAFDFFDSSGVWMDSVSAPLPGSVLALSPKQGAAALMTAEGKSLFFRWTPVGGSEVRFNVRRNSKNKAAGLRGLLHPDTAVELAVKIPGVTVDRETLEVLVPAEAEADVSNMGLILQLDHPDGSRQYIAVE